MSSIHCRSNNALQFFSTFCPYHCWWIYSFGYHSPWNCNLKTQKKPHHSDKVRWNQTLWCPFRVHMVFNPQSQWVDVESWLHCSNPPCTASAPLSSAVLLMVCMHVNEGRIKYDIYKEMFFKAYKEMRGRKGKNIQTVNYLSCIFYYNQGHM